MRNDVCSNFNYNEKADGILELISLNCDKCEFDGNCGIKTAYHNAKDYAASMEFVVNKNEEKINACSECEFFNDSRFYADNSIFVSWGCCMKCQRNMTITNPYQETPEWCPMKGDKDE